MCDAACAGTASRPPSAYVQVEVQAACITTIANNLNRGTRTSKVEEFPTGLPAGQVRLTSIARDLGHERPGRLGVLFYMTGLSLLVCERRSRADRAQYAPAQDAKLASARVC